ncbi:MAG: hypothetical protein Aurels2KO_46240 [Aureliella sp.]
MQSATRLLLCLTLTLIASVLPDGNGVFTSSVKAQEHFPAPAGEESADQRRERELAKRFLTVLRRSPRLGTALDKVYGYHVGLGTLDDFAQSLEQEATEKNDGTAWTILGMVQLQRGQDASAADALRKAEELSPDAPLVSFYLGRSLVLLGEVDLAAEAMQRAISKQPSRADMLQIFQELGRIYQRTGRNEEALAVWADLEKRFPGDLGVQEQIASILAQEGAEEAARQRYTKLAEATKDRFRKVEMSIRAAQLKAKLGKTDEALEDFESQLGVVNPTSWLYRDIRGRIEEVFWSSSDFDGLVKYYSRWVEEHPDDVDAMMRTARVLGIQKRTPEAKEWFRKAIKRAPTNTDARLALVDALANDDEMADAAREMEALVELEPENPDYVVRLGELTLENKKLPKAERAKKAAEIWKRMLKTRGDDPVTVSRVADLLRGADMVDDAIAMYRTASKLAEDQPQYREYLGEYLHQLGRKEEAVKVWEELVAGDRNNLENTVRLSEVFSTFGYPERALETMATACEMGPGFGERARYAELLREAGRYEDALAQLDIAEPLADDRQLRELLIAERIENYKASDTLAERINAVKDAVAEDDAEDASQWRLLALLLEADRKFQAASDAITTATKLDEGNPVIWESAAAIFERTGRFGEAVNAYQKLAGLDRRFLSNYLTQIAMLQMRQGNVDEALEAGEQLLASAASNANNYRFFADLCMQAGEPEKALDILRRGVRSNPNDADALGYLAQTLANEFQTDEAIELYWRQFDNAGGVDEQIPVVEQLTELYLRTNRFDIFVQRLETTAREENKKRDGQLWVAAANQAAGDLGMARQILEQLVREDSRDTGLLEQLVTLSKSEYDYEAAIDYQRRLLSLSPSQPGEYTLAKLLNESGQTDEAQKIWLKLAKQRSTGGNSMLSSVDDLLGKQQFEAAAELAENAIVSEPNNWELMCSAMLAFAQADRIEDAMEVGKKVRAMNVPPETPTKATQVQFASMMKRSNLPPGYDPYAMLGKPETRGNVLGQLRSLLGASNGMFSPFGSRSRQYKPRCFGDVIAVTMALELSKFEDTSKLKAMIKEKTKAALEGDDTDALWDAISYHNWQDPQTVYRSQSPSDEISQLTERLVELGDANAANLKLNRTYNTRNNQLQTGTAKALSDEQLDDLIAATESVGKMLGAGSPYGLWLVQELQLAGRDEAAEERMKVILKQDTDPLSAIRSATMITQLLARNTGGNTKTLEETLTSMLPLLNKALAEADSKTQNINYVISSLSSVLATLCERKMVDEAVELSEALCDLQGRLTADMRPSERSSPQSGNVNYGSIMIGGRYQQLQTTFPPASGYFSRETILAINAGYKGAEAGRTTSEFVSKIAALADAETDDPYQAFARHMAKASVLYWSGDQSGASKALVAADALQLGTQFLSLTRAQLQYASGDVRGALASIEALRPRNQKMLVDRELTLLSLVLQLGDVERAKKSVQKLFALRLDSQTEFKLSEIMYQLGMKELGDRMMGRIRRRSGGKQDTLLELMNRYSTAGKKKEASEIAMQLIRRTEPAFGNVRSPSNTQHAQALQVLVRSGQIDKLIERYEDLVERSPKSLKLVNQLAAMYEAKGRRSDATALRAKVAKLAPKNPANLITSAQGLVRSDPARAIEMFLAAVEKDPATFDRNFSSMRNAFRSEKAWDKLFNSIEKIGISKLQGSYRMQSLAYDMLREKDYDSCNRLLLLYVRDENWAGLANAMRNVVSMMQSSQYRGFELSPEIATSFADAICEDPANLDALANTMIYSYGVDGKPSGMLTTIGALIGMNSEQGKRVRAALEEGLADDEDQAPQRVMLCSIYAEEGDFEKLKETFKPLKDASSRPAMQGKWLIAAQLVDKERNPQFAIEILEAIDTTNMAQFGVSGLGFESSPANLLCSAYENAGQKEKAKSLMVGAIQNTKIDTQQNQYNPGYGEYQYSRTMASLATRLLAADAPAEAYMAFQKAYADDIVKAAGRYGGNMQSARTQLEQKILRKMTPSVVQDLVRSAIVPGDGAAPNQLTAITFASEGTPDERVEIPLERFITKAASDKKLREALVAELTDSALPSDAPLPVIVTRALVGGAAKHAPTIDQCAEALAAWMGENAVDPKEVEGEPLRNELYLSVAVRALQPPKKGEGNNGEDDTEESRDGVPDDLTVAMLDRAIAAASRLSKDSLALGLRLQLASQVASTDKQKARQLYMDALDELLPKDDSDSASDDAKDTEKVGAGGE